MRDWIRRLLIKVYGRHVAKHLSIGQLLFDFVFVLLVLGLTALLVGVLWLS